MRGGSELFKPRCLRAVELNPGIRPSKRPLQRLAEFLWM